MKKKVLLSVFAASLFAAPVALANGDGLGLGATPKFEENPVYVDDINTPATAAQIKDYNDKDLGRKAEQWTRGANKLAKGENLKVDKGEAAKAEKANKPAGQRTLPKTHAVK